MDQDWIEIYRSYSADELSADIERLKKALRESEGINSASSGSKSWQRDLIHLKTRLQAAIRVQSDRSTASLSNREAGLWGVPDFSAVRV